MKDNNTPLSWKTVSSEQGDDLIIFKVRYDQVENPINKHVVKAIVLESNDSVNVIAMTRNNQVVMARQHRFGIQGESLEIPGGFVDTKEKSQVAVQRELREETGFTSQDWEYLGWVYSNPVFMDSKVHHWVARNVERTELTQFDEGEAIQLEVYPISTIKTFLKDGTITHPHTISAFAKYFGF